MDLEEQLQTIVHDASRYGIPPTVVHQALIPAIKTLVLKLKHLNYYLAQNTQKSWIITTLQHRQQPERQKRVIYAFTKAEDAWEFIEEREEFAPEAIGAAELILQLLALPSVDSLIFFDTPGDFSGGIEITRAELNNLIKTKLLSNSIPPNLA